MIGSIISTVCRTSAGFSLGGRRGTEVTISASLGAGVGGSATAFTPEGIGWSAGWPAGSPGGVNASHGLPSGPVKTDTLPLAGRSSSGRSYGPNKLAARAM